MAIKQFSKLDKPVKERIINFLENRQVIMDNPKQSGKTLQGSLSEYWAYKPQLLFLNQLSNLIELLANLNKKVIP